MFYLTVALRSQEICGMYAILPDFVAFPDILWIYPNIADKNVDFPEPIFPTTEINYPEDIFNSLIFKSV